MIGHQQRVSVANEDGCTVVRIAVAQLDYPTMAQIERRIAGGHTTGRGSRIILDLTCVEAIPSVMMGALVDMLNTLQRKGHGLVLVGLNDKVRGSFSITRLDILFDICASVEEARAL